MSKLDRDCPEEEKKYIELRKRNYSQFDRLRKRREARSSDDEFNN